MIITNEEREAHFIDADIGLDDPAVAWDCDFESLLEIDPYEHDEEDDWQVSVLDKFMDREVNGELR